MTPDIGKIWYQLVDSNGEGFRGCRKTKLKIELDSLDIDDLIEAVYEAESRRLSNECLLTDLRAFDSKESLLLNVSIDESISLSQIVNQLHSKPILILVPPGHTSRTGTGIREDVPTGPDSRQLSPGEKTILNASPCALGFFVNLASAKLVTDDNWLDFSPESLEYVASGPKVSKIYLRRCYRQVIDLMGLVNKGVVETEACRYLITGTPGIGKSLFLIFLLWELLQKKKRVLYCSGSTIVYYDVNGSCWIMDAAPALRVYDITQADCLFWREDLYCLYDLQDTKESSALEKVSYRYCQFILCTSPKRSSYNDYVKGMDAKRRFFMPIWSEKEMRRIAPLYTRSNAWEKVYKYLGGIPRSVLSREIHETAALAEIQSGSSICDFQRVKRLTEDPDEVIAVGNMDHIHRIIHIHSTPPFNRPTLQFASEDAIHYVCKAHMAAVESSWKEMVGVDHPQNLCGKLVAKYSEIRALKGLEEGDVKLECKEERRRLNLV